MNVGDLVVCNGQVKINSPRSAFCDEARARNSPPPHNSLPEILFYHTFFSL